MVAGIPSRRQLPRDAERRHDADRRGRMASCRRPSRAYRPSSPWRRKASTTSCSIPTSRETVCCHFTYFAPPKGEAPATWPIEFFYERVWTKPLAERRTMQLGIERVARARG